MKLVCKKCVAKFSPKNKYRIVDDFEKNFI